MRVFITGATGLIGAALARRLRADGDEVVAVTRDAGRARVVLGDGVELVEGDPTEAGAWQARVAGCHGAVNLAGESIGARRWNAHVRQLLLHSRLDVTRHLVDAMAADAGPRVLVSASGIDYYDFAPDLPGEDDDAIDESAPQADTFMAKLCAEWESEAAPAAARGARVVFMRTGMVLGRGAEALNRMALPFKLLAGGRVGSGRQWVSWVHLDDVAGAYAYALRTDALRGPVNLVAPAPVRQAELARELGRALHRPSWLPAPAFAVRAVVGELAEHVLNGRRAVPRALLDAGFAFRYPELPGALAAIYESRDDT